MKNDTQTHAANPADNSTSQHTPGPWDVHENNFMRRFARTVFGQGKALAELYGEDGPEAKANARLIASAPRLKRERDELLAVAQVLLEQLSQLQRVTLGFRKEAPPVPQNWFGTSAHDIHEFNSRAVSASVVSAQEIGNGARALIARIEKGGAS